MLLKDIVHIKHLAYEAILSAGELEAAWRRLHAELKLMSLTDEQVECCQIIAKYLGTSNRKVQVPRAMGGE